MPRRSPLETCSVRVRFGLSFASVTSSIKVTSDLQKLLTRHSALHCRLNIAMTNVTPVHNWRNQAITLTTRNECNGDLTPTILNPLARPVRLSGRRSDNVRPCEGPLPFKLY